MDRLHSQKTLPGNGVQSFMHVIVALGRIGQGIAVSSRPAWALLSDCLKEQTRNTYNLLLSLCLHSPSSAEVYVLLNVNVGNWVLTVRPLCAVRVCACAHGRLVLRDRCRALALQRAGEAPAQYWEVAKGEFQLVTEIPSPTPWDKVLIVNTTQILYLFFFFSSVHQPRWISRVGWKSVQRH